MAEVVGWQDHGGDLHEGAPENMADAATLRIFGPDPETGEDRYYTILEPFPDLYGRDLDDWIDSWIVENYGEFA